MSRTILDVSRWQGRIDWDKVKASGLVSGVMIRAMGNSKEGKPSKPYIDPYFARNYAECQRLDIPVGVYGYFKAHHQGTGRQGAGPVQAGAGRQNVPAAGGCGH